MSRLNTIFLTKEGDSVVMHLKSFNKGVWGPRWWLFNIRNNRIRSGLTLAESVATNITGICSIGDSRRTFIGETE